MAYQKPKIQVWIKDPIRLDHTISKMSKQVQPFVWDFVQRAAAKHLRKEMRSRAPIRTGELWRNISYGKLRRNVYQVGTKLPRRRIVHFIEFGTRPHKIKRRRGRSGVQTIKHPGARPNPFISESLIHGGKPAIQAARMEMVKRWKQFVAFKTRGYDRGAKWVRKVPR